LPSSIRYNLVPIGGVVRLYKDGSIERCSGIPVPCSHGALVNGVTSMDITLDDTTGVWARIFLPDCAIKDDYSVRLLVLIHIPRGGFCIGSPSDPEKNSLYCQRAVDMRSIWVSIAYRRAPEHRLPAGHFYFLCFPWGYWIRSRPFRAVIHCKLSVFLGDLESNFLFICLGFGQVCLCGILLNFWRREHVVADLRR